jgi:glycosyltransferase involved in cell wall biosynthesis
MPRLSIIIPAYNEIATIPELVRRVEAIPVEKQLILVDNVSTDGTREWIRDYDGEAVRIFQDVNLGKGASVRRGLAEADGDVVAIQDADLEYDPSQLPELMAPIVAGAADVVFGSRTLAGKKVAHRSFDLAARSLTTLINWMFWGNLTDSATCYKLMSRDVYRKLELKGNGFDADFEIAARMIQGRYRIVEMPVGYEPRSLAEGKKIRPIDGVYSLKLLILLRLGLL